MQKRSILGIAALVAAALTACGGGDDSSSSLANAALEDYDTVAEREAYVLSAEERSGYTPQSRLYKADPQALQTLNDVYSDLAMAAVERVQAEKATAMSSNGMELARGVTSRPFLAVAHMTNTTAAIDWALGRGANGLEMDLQFDSTGKPTIFQHSIKTSSPCDCSLGIGSLPSLCDVLAPGKTVASVSKDVAKDFVYATVGSTIGAAVWPVLSASIGATTLYSNTQACVAKQDATDILAHIGNSPTAKSQLALVYIDSKFDGLEKSTPAERQQAGRNVVDLLQKNLFDKGYQGQVIIGNPFPSDGFIDYSQAAMTQTTQYPTHSNRYFFSIDKDATRRTALVDTLKHLEGRTNNRVYTAGITALLPNEVFGFYDLYGDISLAAAHENDGASGGTFIWTIDSAATARKYLDLGASGILSNDPATLVLLAREKGLRLATPGDNASSLGMKPATKNLDFSLSERIWNAALAAQSAAINGGKAVVNATVTVVSATARFFRGLW